MLSGIHRTGLFGYAFLRLHGLTPLQARSALLFSRKTTADVCLCFPPVSPVVKACTCRALEALVWILLNKSQRIYSDCNNRVRFCMLCKPCAHVHQDESKAHAYMR